MKKILLIITALCFCFSFSFKSQKLYENPYQWKIPGGNYIDPTSFFSLHGYVNAVFANESKEWTKGSMNGIGMPGQVLIPNTNNSSFQTDEAIWISSEISDKTSVMIELHLVTDPSGKGASGPGGLTLVLTEANANFNLYKSYINVAMGTFWNPFGIHNNDWLGAQNLFSTIPYASACYPAHYNEKGIRIDGFFGKKEKIGLNYVFSLGNGYNSFDISGYGGTDNNNNKTFSGRVSIFPYLEENLNIGVSYTNGLLHKGNSSLSDSSSMYYDNSFESIGADIKLKIKKIELRSYTIHTKRSYISKTSNYSTLNIGYMAELSYKIDIPKIKRIESLVPKIRYDHGNLGLFNKEQNENETFTSTSFGFNVYLNNHFYFSSDYNILLESKESIDNNRIVVRATANF